MASPEEPCIRQGPRRTSPPKKGYDDRCSITAAAAAAGAVDNRGQNMSSWLGPDGSNFYPRNATIAILATVLCPSLCESVTTSQNYAGWIELVFDTSMRAFVNISTLSFYL